jgi:hypothetical protein
MGKNSYFRFVKRPYLALNFFFFLSTYSSFTKFVCNPIACVASCTSYRYSELPASWLATLLYQSSRASNKMIRRAWVNTCRYSATYSSTYRLSPSPRITPRSMRSASFLLFDLATSCNSKPVCSASWAA